MKASIVQTEFLQANIDALNKISNELRKAAVEAYKACATIEDDEEYEGMYEYYEMLDEASKIADAAGTKLVEILGKPSKFYDPEGL